jgi:hypothetical protein
MLLTLKKDSRITTPDQVDQYISARIPALPPLDDLSPAANQQRRYWHLVTTNLLHDCNQMCGGDKGTCSKHFPKPFSDRTELSGLNIFHGPVNIYLQKFAILNTSEFHLKMRISFTVR